MSTKKNSQYKSVKSEYSEVIVSAKAHINFQCLGVMLAKR